MRLQQPLYVDKPVASISIRFEATDVPDSASVLLTDIQLQSGETASGVVPNPREVGTTPARAQYRNGVAAPGIDIIGMSNADRTSPVKMTVRNATGETRIGSYRFGKLSGGATVDGPRHTATKGWGRAPLITERSDLYLATDIEARLHIRLSWNERE